MLQKSSISKSSIILIILLFVNIVENSDIRPYDSKTGSDEEIKKSTLQINNNEGLQKSSQSEELIEPCSPKNELNDNSEKIPSDNVETGPILPSTNILKVEIGDNGKAESVVEETDKILTIENLQPNNNKIDEIDNINPTKNLEAKTEDDLDELVNDKASLEIINNAEKENSKEDLPPFEEWRQKELEVEKGKPQDVKSVIIDNNGDKLSSNTNANSNNQQSQINLNGGKRKTNGVNYSSSRCGAKIVNSNSDSSNTIAMLTENKDSYMNSPCSSKIFFTIELCESISIRAIELGSYELFSSLPKTFVVKISDRWPSKDWRSVGIFHARDTRDIQLFNIINQPNNIIFSKFIKIEMLEHYGTEHYCPISVVRVYGITEDYDDSENQPVENDLGLQNSNDDDDDTKMEINSKPGNLFKAAKDTVLGIVQNFLATNEHSAENNESANEPNITKLNSTTVNLSVENSLTDPLPPNITLSKINTTNEEMFNESFPKTPSGDYNKSTTIVSSLKIMLEKCHDCDFGLHFTSIHFCSHIHTNKLCEYLDLISKNSNSVCCRSCIIESKNDVYPESVNNDVLVEKNNLDAELFSKIENDRNVLSDKNEDKELLLKSEIIIENDSLKTPESENNKIEPNNDNNIDFQQTTTIGPNTAEIQHKTIQLDSESPDSSTNNDNIEKNIDVEYLEIPSNTINKTQSHIYADDQKEKLTNSLDISTEDSSIKLPYDKKLAAVNRLRHKIQELEFNLNLSSRYLDELRQRYRKKMDEAYQNLNLKLKNMSRIFMLKSMKQKQQLDKSNRDIQMLKFNLRDIKISLKSAQNKLDTYFIVFFLIQILFLVLIRMFLPKSSKQPFNDNGNNFVLDSNRRNSIHTQSTLKNKNIKLHCNRSKDDLYTLEKKRNLLTDKKKGCFKSDMKFIQDSKDKNRKKKKKDLIFTNFSNFTCNNSQNNNMLTCKGLHVRKHSWPDKLDIDFY